MDELNKASNSYARENRKDKTSGREYTATNSSKKAAFKAGAKWQAENTIPKVIDLMNNLAKHQTNPEVAQKLTGFAEYLKKESGLG